MSSTKTKLVLECAKLYRKIHPELEMRIFNQSDIPALETEVKQLRIQWTEMKADTLQRADSNRVAMIGCQQLGTSSIKTHQCFNNCGTLISGKAVYCDTCAKDPTRRRRPPSMRQSRSCSDCGATFIATAARTLYCNSCRAHRATEKASKSTGRTKTMRPDEDWRKLVAQVDHLKYTEKLSTKQACAKVGIVPTTYYNKSNKYQALGIDLIDYLTETPAEQVDNASHVNQDEFRIMLLRWMNSCNDPDLMDSYSEELMAKAAIVRINAAKLAEITEKRAQLQRDLAALDLEEADLNQL